MAAGEKETALTPTQIQIQNILNKLKSKNVDEKNISLRFHKLLNGIEPDERLWILGKIPMSILYNLESKGNLLIKYLQEIFELENQTSYHRMQILRCHQKDDQSVSNFGLEILHRINLCEFCERDEPDIMAIVFINGLKSKKLQDILRFYKFKSFYDLCSYASLADQNIEQKENATGNGEQGTNSATRPKKIKTDDLRGGVEANEKSKRGLNYSEISQQYNWFTVPTGGQD